MKKDAGKWNAKSENSKLNLKMLSASSVRTGNIGFRFTGTWKKNIKKLWKESRERSGDCRSFVKKLLLPMSRCMKTGERVHAAFPDGKALYFARAKKGHEGVKGTVTEDYQGILVHDHDITFYNYGTDHQECLAHVLRYLKDSMDNEPDRTWNKEMHGLIQEMIHFRNETRLSCNPDPEKISGFEEWYLKILETARKEYKDIPANIYDRVSRIFG